MGAKTINNTINANKTININVFLNENCKNAMNLEDFGLLIFKEIGIL